MTESLDEVYASPAGVPMRCDVYRPPGSEPLPAVICLHRGGWVSGDKRDVRDLGLAAAEAGFVAVCPNYRLAPLYAFPKAIEDLRELVGWLHANGSAMGVDPTRIGIIGLSAAAYLGCMLGVLPYRNDGRPAVEAVVSVSGLTDLTRPRDQHFPVCWSMIEQYMGAPYEGAEDLYEQASPMFQVGPHAASFLLVHGENDDIVAPSQSEIFAVALRDEGVPVELSILPNEGHTLSVSAWENTQVSLFDFLARRLCLL